MSMDVIDSRPVGGPKRLPRCNPQAHARSWLRAMIFGAQLRCPSCGEGHLYEDGRGKVVNYCPHCEEELYHHRASRMAPWFSAFLSAHFAIFAALAAAWLLHPPLWALAVPAMILWVGLTWLLMPPVKGMIVGLQWAFRLHGFQYAAMCKPRHPHKPHQQQT